MAGLRWQCRQTQTTVLPWPPWLNAPLSSLAGLTCLVNSVGTNIKNRAFAEMRPADWDMMIAHNLTVAYNLVDAVLPVMRAQGTGTIIHYSSDAVQKPNVVSGIAYQATKHGVRGLAHGTMMEERDARHPRFGGLPRPL